MKNDFMILGEILMPVIWEEEQKIGEELEAEIEMDLGEEIKDGIRQHALRLLRLQQHKKVRTYSSASRSCVSLQSGSNDAATKVNLTVTTEGEFKIAVYESRRRVGRKIERFSWPRASDSRPESFVTTVRRR